MMGSKGFQPISAGSAITPCRRTHEEKIGEKQRSNRGRSVRADIIIASKTLLEGCLTWLGKMLSKPCAQQAGKAFAPNGLPTTIKLLPRYACSAPSVPFSSEHHRMTESAVCLDV